MRRPLIVAAAVAVLGFAFVATGETSPGSACYGKWHWHEAASFPPGAQVCHTDAGDTKTVLPWGDWLTVLLIAASAGLFVGGLQSRDRKIVRAAVAYVLFIAAVLAWFIASALVWAVLAAVVAATVLVAARGWPATA
ncbi:MAG: hypothetical protein M3320_10725 [Actinomycetota bacterium]|nr:hypothetical protein [Actinomycetota bacterium]MDQ5809138.1 hypothetical protein [Actinomycetota bacterium]